MKHINYNSTNLNIKNIAPVWQANDALVFIIDIDDYNIYNVKCLSKSEHLYLQNLKTLYFQKRYIVSRILLKYLISTITEQNIACINTFKDKFGQIQIENYEEFYICFAYTKNTLAMCISKMNIGIDIEVLKQINHSYVQFSLKSGDLQTSKESEFIDMWLLKEAYCKYFNKNLIDNLNAKIDIESVNHILYLVDRKYKLAAITAKYCKLNIYKLEKVNI